MSQHRHDDNLFFIGCYVVVFEGRGIWKRQKRSREAEGPWPAGTSPAVEEANRAENSMSNECSDGWEGERPIQKRKMLAFSACYCACLTPMPTSIFVVGEFLCVNNSGEEDHKRGEMCCVAEDLFFCVWGCLMAVAAAASSDQLNSNQSS
uniref:Uncharacterized protein n=1 Tax=Ditylenchus dipsaci TaxID=166011 RepID=A0A915CQR7_9BILA